MRTRFIHDEMMPEHTFLTDEAVRRLVGKPMPVKRGGAVIGGGTITAAEPLRDDFGRIEGVRLTVDIDTAIVFPAATRLLDGIQFIDPPDAATPHPPIMPGRHRHLPTHLPIRRHKGD